MAPARPDSHCKQPPQHPTTTPTAPPGSHSHHSATPPSPSPPSPKHSKSANNQAKPSPTPSPRTLLGKKTLLLLDNAEHLLPNLATDLAALLQQCPTLTPPRHQPRTPPTRRRNNLARPHPHRTRRRRALHQPRHRSRHPPPTRRHHPRTLPPPRPTPPRHRTRSRPHPPLHPTQLLDRLGQRLDLLKGARDTDPRQHTLRATIEWSYQLLDDEEQRVYRTLSVFAGGATLDAAEHVTGADPDTLQSLLDKSLLRRRTDNTHEPRYWMLETIRQHAAGKVAETGEEEAVVDRFLPWVQGIVGDVDEVWVDRDQLEWFDTLERERENLLGAITRCGETGRAVTGVLLMVGAGEWIAARGPYGYFADLIGRIRRDDSPLVARVTWMRGVLLSHQGRFEECRAEARRALELAEAAGDRATVADTLGLSSWALQMTGDIDGAIHQATRSLEIAEASGATGSIASASGVLGNALDLAGYPERAISLAERSAERFTQIGDLNNAMIQRSNLGAILLGNREPNEAVPVIEQALELAERLGHQRYVAVGHGNRATALAALGEPGQARAAAYESVRAARKAGARDGEIEAIATLALIAAVERDDERAVRLWAAWASANAAIDYSPGNEITRYIDQLLEPLRQLPDFELHWQAGEKLSIEEALELGLVESSPATP